MPERRNRSELFRDRVREMRSQPNDVESMLRNDRLKGFKFRRQHPIGPYIADFYCAGARLIVELDGKTHDGKEQYDAGRQGWLEAQGLAVMRYPTSSIVSRRCSKRFGPNVSSERQRLLAAPAPHPSPRPGVPGRGEDSQLKLLLD